MLYLDTVHDDLATVLRRIRDWMLVLSCAVWQWRYGCLTGPKMHVQEQ